MTERLLFRLEAPLAAWGEIAVGEIRSSWPEPSKSAVLGLVAAALGVTRAESCRHRALHEGLAFAVRVHDQAGPGKRRAPSRPLRDYHTAQAPSARRGAHWPTRADELRPTNDLNTILSERWYWQHFAATVALTPKGAAVPPLETLLTALKRPAFPLYLGRKSCPPGRPLRPAVIEHESLVEAFNLYDGAEVEAWRQVYADVNMPPAPPRLGQRLWRDGEVGDTPRRYRRDTVRNRSHWTFEERGETAVEIAPNPEDA
jgi:CRISPR system Cascade subunit CasD